MPITPTYPGIYIEELPSHSHAIAAAPTSITVFVGYTHPYKTKNFNHAVQLFSFADYEREFGGLYTSGVFDSNVASAVMQYFVNGGSVAYVIGLQPKFYRDLSGTITGTPDATDPLFPASPTPRPKLTLGGIVFRALEPTDGATMSVTINNPQPSDPATPATKDVADIIITYGSRIETFRRVTINPNPVNAADKANYIETRINGVSSLVTVSPNNAAPPLYGTTITTSAIPSTFNAGLPADLSTTFSEGDFIPVFQQDTTLDKISIFNLLLVPGVADNSVWSAALAFCERKQAFVIMDPPRDAAADPSSAPLKTMADEMDNVVPKSPNGAIYFPYLNSQDPLTGNAVELPPSGFVAGIFARTDTNRGVWKAPAGLETTVLNTTGVVSRGRMTDMRQGTLNQKGVNCLRSFPGIGTVVYGARTLVSENVAFQQWKYVPVRRMALFIEQTLYRNLGWVVFEPNDEPLWIAIRTSIENFMLSLFNQGAFQGTKPSQAFLVQCDKSTTTQTDVDNGIVNVVVGFAPLKPAEFVIVKIAQLAGQVQS
ncbi:MAG: uncharacterized protein QOE33_3478 [Acidobacteriota bacterium]|nr:uncharacterized protein [Acidobacteriota bacterium]